MAVDIGILISVLGVGLSVLTFFIGQKAGAKKEGEKQGSLLTELAYIKQDLSELKKDFKQINVEKIHCELNELRSRQVQFDESVRRLHNRIDDHLSRQHNMNTERMYLNE